MKNMFESSIKRHSSSIDTTKVPSGALASPVMSSLKQVLRMCVHQNALSQRFFHRSKSLKINCNCLSRWAKHNSGLGI